MTTLKPSTAVGFLESVRLSLYFLVVLWGQAMPPQSLGADRNKGHRILSDAPQLRKGRAQPTAVDALAHEPLGRGQQEDSHIASDDCVQGTESILFN